MVVTLTGALSLHLTKTKLTLSKSRKPPVVSHTRHHAANLYPLPRMARQYRPSCNRSTQVLLQARYISSVMTQVSFRVLIVFAQYYSGVYPPPPIAESRYNGRSSISETMGMPMAYAGMGPGDPRELDPSAASYPLRHSHDGPQFTLPHRGQPDQVMYRTTSPEYGQPTEYAAEYPSEYPAGYLVTEQRKLHISTFPQQVRVEEVTTWIRRKAGAYATYISDIEVPQNPKSLYLRGHALVIFNNTAAAQWAMALLNKARFQGRRVTARLAVEGVIANETAIPTGPRALDSGWNRRSHRSKHKDPRGASSSSSSQHPRSSSDKKHSSSSHDKSSSSGKKGSSSSSSDKKKPSSDCRSGKEPGPVIVDGTFHGE